MNLKSEIRAEAAQLQAKFIARGATSVEADILQPSKVLLDLYGEDIRARAYVTHDPLRGETMLRPDFTVPVAQMHLASGDALGSYTYAGEVFRRQEEDETRAREYVQVGYERFGGQNAEDEDAEIFTAMAEALSGLKIRSVVGDIGIITALIDDLDTPARRKVALKRHIWRPARFHELLDRYASPSATRRASTGSPHHVGLRSRAEVSERMAVLADEASTPPVPRVSIDLIDAVLGISGPAETAVARLVALAPEGSALADAVKRLENRLSKIDLQGVKFEASYGLTTMEYYGGFVFGFLAASRPDLPPVATGGRYDAVTAVLGQAVPAVGGVIRPDLVLGLKS